MKRNKALAIGLGVLFGAQTVPANTIAMERENVEISSSDDDSSEPNASEETSEVSSEVETETETEAETDITEEETEVSDELDTEEKPELGENIDAIEESTQEDSFSKGDLDFEQINGEIVITGIARDGIETLIIPATYEGKPVTRIEDEALFDWNRAKDFKEVIIYGNTYIGDNNFNVAYGTKITAPNVTAVGNNVFNGAGEVYMPSLKEAGDYLFKDSPMESLNLPSLETVGKNFVNGCDYLEEVTLPSLKTVGENTFTLSTIKNLVLDNVTEIDSKGFYSSYVEKLSMASLITVPERAFAGCDRLTSINLPVVISIGAGAFIDCSNLTEIRLNGEVSIENAKVFNDNTTVYIEREKDPAGLDKNADVWGGVLVYSDFSLAIENVQAESGVTFVDGNSEENVVLAVLDTDEDTVTVDELRAFCDENLAMGYDHLILKDENEGPIEGDLSVAGNMTVKVYYDYAWTQDENGVTITEFLNNKSHYTTPETINGLPVKQIGADERVRESPSIFVDNDNDSITLTITNAEIIGQYAFYGCSKLTGNLILPEEVTSIEQYAFHNCGGFTGNLVIPYGVESIGKYSFGNCNGFKGTLTLPSSLKSIGFCSFYGCSGFTGELVIPDGVNSIGQYAFYNCSGFNETLTLSSTLTSIGTYAFQGCSGFTGDLTIPDGVTSIGSFAFRYCGNLSVTLPTSLTSIGNSVFANSNNISLTIPDEFTLSLPSDTFGNATDVKIYVGGNVDITRVTPAFNSIVTAYIDRVEDPTGIDKDKDEWEVEEIHYHSAVHFLDYEGVPILGEDGKPLVYSNPNLTDDIYAEERYAPSDKFEVTVETLKESAGNLPRLLDAAGNEMTDGTTITVSGTVLVTAEKNRVFFVDSEGNEITDQEGDQLVIEANASVVTEDELRAFCDENLAMGYDHLILKDENEEPIEGDLSVAGNMTVKVYYDYAWTQDENGVTITEFLNNKSHYTTPETINDLPVKQIGADERVQGSPSIFVDNDNDSITLTITKAEIIGQYAFYGCSKLTGNLILPEEVTSIGQNAFRGCNKLTGDLAIPNGVTSIGQYAFYGCSGFNGTLTLSNSLKNIEQYVFHNCSGFTGDLVIPEGVTSIGMYSFGNVRFDGTLTLPSTLKSIGFASFFDNRFTGGLVIPDEVNSIGAYAFYKCKGFNGTLTLSSTLTSIGANAFQDCSGFNGTLTLPSTLTSIGDSAFQGCSGFTGDLTIPDSVTSIGNSVFYGCSSLNGTLTLPSRLTSIGTHAFRGCSGFTGDLTIPDGVTSIGTYAFYNCSGFNGTLTLPSTLTSIGDYVFQGCSGFTGDLTIPDGVTSIGTYAFYNCSGFNGTLTLPSTLTSIGDYAYQGCSGFTGDLTIPDGVTSIGNSVFYGCSSLNGTLTLPSRLTSIGTYAFYNCSGFNGTLTLPSTLTSIGDYAFAYCENLSTILPASLTSVGENLFGNSNNINVTLPKELEVIGNSMFSNAINPSLTILDEFKLELPDTTFDSATDATIYVGGNVDITLVNPAFNSSVTAYIDRFEADADNDTWGAKALYYYSRLIIQDEDGNELYRRDGDISNGVENSRFTISVEELKSNMSDYNTFEIINKDGSLSTITEDSLEIINTVTIKVSKVPVNSTITDDNIIYPSEVTYGDTITIKVKPTEETVGAKATDVVELYKDNTLLATSYIDNEGYYVIEYDTSDKKLQCSDNTLKVVFTGNDDLLETERELTIEVKAKSLDLDFGTISLPYGVTERSFTEDELASLEIKGLLDTDLDSVKVTNFSISLDDVTQVGDEVNYTSSYTLNDDYYTMNNITGNIEVVKATAPQSETIEWGISNSIENSIRIDIDGDYYFQLNNSEYSIILDTTFDYTNQYIKDISITETSIYIEANEFVLPIGTTVAEFPIILQSKNYEDMTIYIKLTAENENTVEFNITNYTDTIKVGDIYDKSNIVYTVLDVLGNTIDGDITLDPDPSQLSVGTYTINVTFTPDDIDNFETAQTEITITVVNEVLTQITPPTTTYPNKVDSTISDFEVTDIGTYVDEDGNTVENLTFNWVLPEDTVVEPNKAYEYTVVDDIGRYIFNGELVLYHTYDVPTKYPNGIVVMPNGNLVIPDTNGSVETDGEYVTITNGTLQQYQSGDTIQIEGIQVTYLNGLEVTLPTDNVATFDKDSNLILPDGSKYPTDKGIAVLPNGGLVTPDGTVIPNFPLLIETPNGDLILPDGTVIPNNPGYEKDEEDNVIITIPPYVLPGLLSGGNIILKLDGSYDIIANETYEITTEGVILDKDGNLITEVKPNDLVITDNITNNTDGSVIFPDGGIVNGTTLPNESIFYPLVKDTVTEDSILINPDGTYVNVGAGSIITSVGNPITNPDGTITYPNGGTIQHLDGTITVIQSSRMLLPTEEIQFPDGGITGDGVVIKPNDTITAGGVITNPDGTITLPNGGIIVDQGGNETVLPPNTVITPTLETGGNNTGNTGGSNTGNTGGSNTGNTGGNNTGNTGGNNTGNTGGNNTGNTGGNNTGNTGGSNAGNTEGNNSDSGNNTENTGGNNIDNTYSNNVDNTENSNSNDSSNKNNIYGNNLINYICQAILENDALMDYYNMEIEDLEEAIIEVDDSAKSLAEFNNDDESSSTILNDTDSQSSEIEENSNSAKEAFSFSDVVTNINLLIILLIILAILIAIYIIKKQNKDKKYSNKIEEL